VYSDTLESDSTAASKKRVNFVAKNRQAVGGGTIPKKKPSTRAANMNAQGNAGAEENELVIRCLNDVVEGPLDSKPEEPMECLSLEASNQIEFDISIISTHSSVMSEIKPKVSRQPLEARSHTTTNSSTFRFVIRQLA